MKTMCACSRATTCAPPRSMAREHIDMDFEELISYARGLERRRRCRRAAIGKHIGQGRPQPVITSTAAGANGHMRIETIKAYRVLQPFVDGPYNMSKGRSADAFDAVIVAITSDNGLTGWGEMAPLGNFYSPAFAAGARAGVAEIAPHLLGHDPRALNRIARLMDTVFKGHPYIKSALDMACWDLAARAADMPLVTLLGGARQRDGRALQGRHARAGRSDGRHRGADRRARVSAACRSRSAAMSATTSSACTRWLPRCRRAP